MATLNSSSWTLITQCESKESSWTTQRFYDRVYGMIKSVDNNANTTTVTLQWRSAIKNAVSGSGGVYNASKRNHKFSSLNAAPSLNEDWYIVGSSTSVKWKTTDEHTKATWDMVFTHDNDGTYSKNCTMVSPDFDDYHAITTTGNITLPALNRAAALTVSPLILESGNATITATNRVATNKCTLWYRFNDSGVWTQMGAAQSAGATITRTLAYTDLANAIGTATTAAVNIRCQTWLADGTTDLGYTYINFTIQTGKIPMSWKDDLAGNVGVTIGEKATASGFNVMLPTKFKIDNALGDVLADYVVDKGYSMTASSIATNPVYTPGGNNDTQTWRLWNSGLMELWGNVWIQPADGSRTSTTITFPYTLDTSKPITATTTSFSGRPDEVRETSVSAVTSTGCSIWIYRTSTTKCAINYHITGYVA